MKQSATLGATLACAQAIQLSSKAEFIPIPSFDIPDIPIVSDIPDVVNDGIDYIDTGLTDFGDIVIDGIDVTITGIEEMGNGIEDMGTLIYDDVLVPTGTFTYDELEYLGTGFYGVTTELVGFDHDDVADFVVDDVGSFVIDDVGGFVVDDIGGVVTDTYDWASNGGNWEAFGKTLLAGYSLYFQGDFEGAADVWLNEEHYTEEFYDDLEEQKRAHEEALRIQAENEEKLQKNIEACDARLTQYKVAEVEHQEEQDQILRDGYEEYLVKHNTNAQEQLENHQQAYTAAKADYDAERDLYIEYYENTTSAKAEYCASEPQPIDYRYEVPITGTTLTTYMTKTQYFSYQIGTGYADWAWENLFDPAHVTRETCEEEDCLHRCYGTAMTSHCGLCYDYIFTYASQIGVPEVQQLVKEQCNKCEVPPTEDPQIPEEYPAYEVPTVSEPMTFVEYEDKIYELLEEQNQEPVDEIELTPEELEKQQEYEAIENFCKAHVPEYADYFASRESN